MFIFNVYLLVNTWIKNGETARILKYIKRDGNNRVLILDVCEFFYYCIPTVRLSKKVKYPCASIEIIYNYCKKGYYSK